MKDYPASQPLPDGRIRVYDDKRELIVKFDETGQAIGIEINFDHITKTTVDRFPLGRWLAIADHLNWRLVGGWAP